MLRAEGPELREALRARGCSVLFVSCVVSGVPIRVTREPDVGAWFTSGTLSTPLPAWWGRATDRPLVLIEGAHSAFCTLDDHHPRPRVRTWVAGIDYHELPKGEALTPWLWRRVELFVEGHPELERTDLHALRDAILALCDEGERADWSHRWASAWWSAPGAWK